MRKYIAAIAQIDTTTPWEENMVRIEGFVDEAHEKGASFIAFPESFSQFIGGKTPAEPMENSPTLERMKAKAKQHSMWILCGSLYTPSPEGEKKSNTSILIDPEGNIVSTYDKMHMFDVTLPDGSQRCESSRFRGGTEIVNAETALGNLGMTVCYDVRFPELYRLLTLRGAEVLLIPAMFTKSTGQLCWEVLLRARAVENGCYVVAPNQVGGRFGSYGHSMIVDPEGKILCEIPEGEGVAVAEIDLDYVAQIRQKMPCLAQRRTDMYQLDGKK